VLVEQAMVELLTQMEEMEVKVFLAQKPQRVAAAVQPMTRMGFLAVLLAVVVHAPQEIPLEHHNKVVVVEAAVE
jgi:hypothetical protein